MAALGAGATRPSVVAETLVLSAEECGHIARHDPAGAAYEPGVDARGGAVVSADLDSIGMDLPDDLSIDLTALVFELLQREPPLGFGDTKIALGKTVVNKSGLITYNDKLLGTSTRTRSLRLVASAASSDGQPTAVLAPSFAMVGAFAYSRRSPRRAPRTPPSRRRTVLKKQVIPCV